MVDASRYSCDVVITQQIVELRFEGVCCRAGLENHKKGDVAGDISTLMPIELCSPKDRLARPIESVAVFAV